MTPSRLYPNEIVRPDDLIRIRVPVDPPIYRRVLIPLLTDAIEISIPYHYKADQKAATTATLRIDGMVTVPNLWMRSHSFVSTKEIKVEGDQIKGVETLVVSVSQLLAEMEANRNDYGIGNEALEVTIRPVFEVQVAGLREPVSVTNNPEFRLTLRQHSLEVDDTTAIRLEQKMSETRVVPITTNVFGMVFQVGTLRNAAVTVGLLMLAYTSLLLWRRIRKQTPEALLAKLGPRLVTVSHFEPPTSIPVADLNSVRDMLQLQAQSDRPIMKVGKSYYLLDGATCYRLMVNKTDLESGPGAPSETAEERLRQMAVVIQSELMIDPLLTRIQVQTANDMLKLQKTTGRTMIRSPKAYQMIDGMICYELESG